MPIAVARTGQRPHGGAVRARHLRPKGIEVHPKHFIHRPESCRIHAGSMERSNPAGDSNAIAKSKCPGSLREGRSARYTSNIPGDIKHLIRLVALQYVTRRSAICRDRGSEPSGNFCVSLYVLCFGKFPTNDHDSHFRLCSYCSPHLSTMRATSLRVFVASAVGL